MCTKKWGDNASIYLNFALQVHKDVTASVEQIPYSPLAGFSNPPPWVLEIFRLPHEYQMMTQH